jgi:pimeloyl-ACP methyl ester carboxylesterase
MSIAMIEETQGAIDYDEHGSGPTIVFVPGSCSTGAAWRPVIAALEGRFRAVTTSLLGYGNTAERRPDAAPSIELEAEIVESVVRRAGGTVHLAGHSFGGLAALMVALRGRVPLSSLIVLEAPVVEILRERGEEAYYRDFRAMTDSYFRAFAEGNVEAIAAMVDFYAGEGAFAAWPARVRDYAIRTTAANILDWRCAYALHFDTLPRIALPTLFCIGSASHPAMRRANDLAHESIPGADLAEIPGAAHFMISTHPAAVAHEIAAFVDRVEFGKAGSC